MRYLRAVIAVFSVLATLGVPFDAYGESGPWRDCRRLIGAWSGEGSGFGNDSKVSHVWEFILDDQFIRLSTRSVSINQDGTEEVHEDIGFLSYDSDREVLVFRQFLSEGYVNIYDVTTSGPGDSTIAFGHREAESTDGVRARMRLTFVTSDKYEMVLDLAFPGKDFTACQQMEMHRGN